MTIRLSPHRVSKIVKGYFGGMTQGDIADRVGTDQSTVSLYSSRFKERAGGIGLLAAAKEVGVFNEVEALRSLAVELSKAELTVGDAKEGLGIMKTFIKLGVGSQQHAALVGVCKEISDPGFVHAALKLRKMEAEGNITYEQVMARLEKATLELSAAEKKLRDIRAKVQSAAQSLMRKQHEETRLQAHVQQLQNEAAANEAQLKQQLASKMKQFKVKLAEVEEVSALKVGLARSGLDIPTLVKLGKEYAK